MSRMQPENIYITSIYITSSIYVYCLFFPHYHVLLLMPNNAAVLQVFKHIDFIISLYYVTMDSKKYLEIK